MSTWTKIALTLTVLGTIGVGVLSMIGRTTASGGGISFRSSGWRSSWLVAWIVFLIGRRAYSPRSLISRDEPVTNPLKRRRAFLAELCRRVIIVLAPVTLHGAPPGTQAGEARDAGARVAVRSRMVKGARSSNEAPRGCNAVSFAFTALSWSLDNQKWNVMDAEIHPSRR